MHLLDTLSLDGWFDIKDTDLTDPWAALCLDVPDTLSAPGAWAGVLNCCARVGLCAPALDHPVLISRNDVFPCRLILRCRRAHDSQEVCLERKSGREICLRYSSQAVLGRILNALALGRKDWKKCLSPSLESLSSPEASPELLDWHHAFDRDEARPGFRHLNLGWSLASPLSYRAGHTLSRAVTAAAMAATSAELPLVWAEECVDKLPDHRIQIRETDSPDFSVDFHPEGGPPRFQIQGNARALASHLLPWVDLALHSGGPGLAPILGMRRRLAEARLPQNPGEALISPPASIELATTPASEEADIRAAFAELPPGSGPLTGEIWLSKPEPVRRALADDLTREAEALGYAPEIRVYNAAKPGLCRILDGFAQPPAGLETIEIRYAPFGGSPAPNTPRNLEFPHRWLQELFPVAEILAQRLDLAPDGVTLTLDENLDTVYAVRGMAGQGEVLVADDFSPPCLPRIYMPGEGLSFVPDFEQVSPGCSGIRLATARDVLVEKRIPTDRDRFWTVFQTEFIPRLDRAMAEMLDQGSVLDHPAFFREILVEVAIEETAQPLGFMDEQVSPMEKLHEDIYFYLLDFYGQFSKAHNLPDSLKLGQIIPRVSPVTDQPRATLSAIPADLSAPVRTAPPEIGPETLTWDAAGVTIQGANLSQSVFFPADRLPEHDPDLGFLEKIPGPVATAPVPRDQVLGAEATLTHLARLNTHDTVRVHEIARSLQNRPIYAVEVFKETGRVSIPRLRMARPTVLFNARHHANEVSSTNATLAFIEWLASEEGGALLEKANVVFLPLENVDGVATFESLYREGCCDILHAARYNALGAEFYPEYFNHPPAFPEALAKQRLWHRWLPQLMADLHGVPGHEWCQPYSGYLPKNFEEFWIPRAFVYVHLPFVEDDAHPMYKTNMELAETLRCSVAKEEDLVAANRDITALYQRYAREPEPEIFPPAESTELTVLPMLGRARHVNFADRFPEITRSEVIVEVPDEVAHGENLARCIKAHYVIQQALARDLVPAETWLNISGTPDALTLEWMSERPEF